MDTAATAVADSVSSDGHRLTTLLLRYPRLIHAQLLTHRSLSRNTASSRAIPTARKLRRDVYVPAAFGANGKGMAAAAELTGWRHHAARATWRATASACRLGAWALSKVGVHKEHANRPLDWCEYVDVLVTANGDALDAFVELRSAADAQPEMRALARSVGAALRSSTPVRRPSSFALNFATGTPESLLEGKWAAAWHLPFTPQGDVTYDGEMTIVPPSHLSGYLKLSTARAGRLSYLTHDGNFSMEADYSLHDRMLKAKHFSAFEHAAVAVADAASGPVRCRNLTGWVSYRAILDGKGVRG